MTNPRHFVLQGRLDNGLLIMNSPHARHPLRLRPRTSDPLVFFQIFVLREYACLDNVREAALIIDCGANIGCSAAYFLSRFPTCQLIAVEPDADNFQLLRQNLAPYGNRVEANHSAVWSNPARLTMAETPYRDGQEWARQVRECRPEEEAGLQAVDMNCLLARSGHDRISILKMDIEGAEAIVFAENTQWLERVDNLVVELHDDSVFGNASTVFARAIAGCGFTVRRHQELTVCQRLS